MCTQYKKGVLCDGKYCHKSHYDKYFRHKVVAYGLSRKVYCYKPRFRHHKLRRKYILSQPIKFLWQNLNHINAILLSVEINFIKIAIFLFCLLWQIILSKKPKDLVRQFFQPKNNLKIIYFCCRYNILVYNILLIDILRQ